MKIESQDRFHLIKGLDLLFLHEALWRPACSYGRRAPVETDCLQKLVRTGTEAAAKQSKRDIKGEILGSEFGHFFTTSR